MNHFIGHQNIWKQLSLAKNNKRLGSSLLFLGPEGIGKYLVAKDLAQWLLCEHPTLAGADHQCHSCHLFKQQQHPDLQIIESDSTIKIDVIRTLLEQTRFAPYLNQAKVIIIRDAHTMNLAASNALLKLLEEPPERFYFILTSHSVGKLLATIRSRCQKFVFQLLEQMDLKNILGENANFPQSWLQLGSPGLILNWQKIQNLVEHSFWKSYFDKPNKVNTEQLFLFLQEYKNCEDQKAFLHSLLFSLSLQLKQNPDKNLMLLSDQINELQRMQVYNLNPSLSLEYLLTQNL